MTFPKSVTRQVSRLPSLPFYYGWVIVVLASVAMTATLPGRTHGLGLITEPLLADLQIDRSTFARMNMLACLLGSLCCLPIGSLLDRYGSRLVLTMVSLGLGIAVWGMTIVHGLGSVFFLLLIVRGLGQSALSVVSLSLINQWFRRRLGPAMGLFSILLTIGFIASILFTGGVVEMSGWRVAWRYVSVSLLLGLVPLSLLLARNRPEDCGLALDGVSSVEAAMDATDSGMSLLDALRTPTFWLFVVGSSLFNFVWSGLTLFNQSILAEREFEPRQAIEVMALLTGCGLVANAIGGLLASRARLRFLLSAGMVLLAGTLAGQPYLANNVHLRLYGMGLGLAGGIVTVVFFAAWGQLFGRRHLGRIQGAAQAATVIASALGPVFFAEIKSRTGTYSWAFQSLAIAAVAVAIAAAMVRDPILDDRVALRGGK